MTAYETFEVARQQSVVVLQVRPMVPVPWEFRDELFQFAETTSGARVVLDFSNIDTFMSGYPRMSEYSWVGDVIQFQKRIESSSGEVLLAGVNEAVRDGFRFYNAESHVTFADDAVARHGITQADDVR